MSDFGSILTVTNPGIRASAVSFSFYAQLYCFLPAFLLCFAAVMLSHMYTFFQNKDNEQALLDEMRKVERGWYDMW